MPSTFLIPDYGVTVYGSADGRKHIAGGGAPVFIDGIPLTSPTTVDRAVHVTGPGAVISVSDASEVPKPPAAQNPVKPAKARKKAK